MKILIINSVCGIGSTGRICTDLAIELEKQGHEVKIAYSRGAVPIKFQKYSVRIGNNFDLYMHVLKSRIFDSSGFESKKATNKFIRWVKDYNPDIIHLHNLHGYYINIDILFNYLKTCNKKIIWTLHDCWAFTGHCSHFDFVRCNKWKNGCDNCPQLKEYPASILLDRSERNYNRKQRLFTGINNMTLVTPSYWLAGLIQKSFLKEYNIEIVHNSIDTNVFKPTPSEFRKKYNLENKKIILGVASVWNRRKGLCDFIKLSEMLDDRFKIVLVGLSQKQIKRLPSSIIAIQRTDSPKELAEIYTTADVFVNPTYEDNYPTVNLEAEACGTRVITYDTGGCRETIKRSDSIVIDRDVNILMEMVLNF